MTFSFDDASVLSHEPSSTDAPSVPHAPSSDAPLDGEPGEPYAGEQGASGESPCPRG